MSVQQGVVECKIWGPNVLASGKKVGDLGAGYNFLSMLPHQRLDQNLDDTLCYISLKPLVILTAQESSM